MEIILLERIEKLGQMGDVVSVKPGYARNFLLPEKKAVTATKANKEYFEGQRAQLETQNLEHKKEAEAVSEKLAGLFISMVRQAGDAGQLYGSVNARDIANGVTDAGFTVTRNQVSLDKPIKTVGLHEVRISLHPEVSVTITANVARSEEEAEIQERTGEAVVKTEEEEVAAPDVEAAAPEAESGEDAEEAGEEASEDNQDESQADAGEEAEEAPSEDTDSEDQEEEKS